MSRYPMCASDYKSHSRRDEKNNKHVTTSVSIFYYLQLCISFMHEDFRIILRWNYQMCGHILWYDFAQPSVHNFYTLLNTMHCE